MHHRLDAVTRDLRAALIGLLLAPAWMPAAAAIDAAADPLAMPRFETVGAGQIPRGVVATMAQDRAGFLWIATGDGLVRYDGYRFPPRERDDAPAAKRNLGWVRALLAARDGRLWIGTESDGLAEYDPATERVRLRRPPAAGAGASPTIAALAEAVDGSVWIGSLGEGLTHFDPAADRFTVHRHSAVAGSLPDDRVSALLVAQDGTLWVGTGRGLARRPLAGPHFDPVTLPDAPAERTVQALLETGDGRIWAGTAQGELVIVDPASGRAEAWPAPPGAGAITALLQSPDGRVWVGRSTGIDLHDSERAGKVLALRHDARQRDGLAGNEVTTLLRDRAGWIWVAGFGLGLQRHNPGNHGLRVLGPDAAPGGLLANPALRALLARDDGEVWAALHTGGVVRFDAGLRVLGPLTGPGGGATRVATMAQGADGSAWLATADTLVQRGRAGEALRRVALGGLAPRHLWPAADGTLWVATEAGLWVLRPGTDRLQRLALADGRPLVAEAMALAEDAQGDLWVGTALGLYRVPRGAAALSPVETAPDAGLGNPVVIGLLFDRAGTLWLDTAVTGLHRRTHWDGQRAGFEQVSVRHGIVSRPFGANLLEDARGRIWTHMHVYDPATDRLQELTAADGVSFGTGWFRSYAGTPDGRLLFGGSRGLLVVDPAQVEPSTDMPPVVVSELRINGVRASAARLGDALVIAPDERSFSVEFAALDYSEPARLRYAYRLEGFDPDWIATGADFRAPSYSNLPPGDYLLRVRGSNRSGVWSPHELALPVQVLPAWWQTWASRLTALLLLAAVVAGVVQWRTRQLRRQRLALEDEVQDRTAELQTLAQALQLESAALADASLTDPLTGLRNRRYLAQHIEADTAIAVRRYESHWQPPDSAPLDDADLVFFLIDIDHFKHVNDVFGHAAGDAMLAQMRARLRQVFRESDHLVRWGGEEFLVVARGASRAHAAELAERLRAAVAGTPFDFDDGRQLQRSCSIGFSAFPPCARLPRALDWNDTVRCADAALYLAKAAGRNGWAGLVSAQAPSADALAALLRRPLDEAARAGAVELQRSAPRPPG